MNKRFLIISITAIFFAGYAFIIGDLPRDTSSLFSGSGNCTMCHSGENGVMINNSGRDVSPVYHWQSSMMGNSSLDPYWRAKVSSEVEKNPHLKEIIEDKCATCHAPMGRTEAIAGGTDSFSFDEVKTDPLSLDGVSCTLCHQIDTENLGTEDSFSGAYTIKSDKVIYGPYENPFVNSMLNNTGFTPSYGVHIESSELCAVCHTLFTPYVDQNGDVAGYFPEQTPYFEWLAGAYPEKNQTCQECHMPRVNEDYVISTMPPNLQNKRNPVFEHRFVGGNYIINRMIAANFDELGINAGKANIDTTARHTLQNLSENSVALSAEAKAIDGVVSVDIIVKNKTGHKLPTGFPSRRMWIRFVATDDDGNVVFESGEYDANGEIVSQKGPEQHHDQISEVDQAQIYEAVLGNMQNEFTTVLLEASQYLKDNRLPPEGFKTGTPFDAFIAVTGAAAEDSDFNKNDEGEPGTGSDRVTYEFPFTGDKVNFAAEICHQSVKPSFAKSLAESSTDESKAFTRMFGDQNLSKVETIASIEGQVSLSGIEEKNVDNWRLYPNPARGKVFLGGEVTGAVRYSIYSLDGGLVTQGDMTGRSIPLDPTLSGTYLVEIVNGKRKKAFMVISY